MGTTEFETEVLALVRRYPGSWFGELSSRLAPDWSFEPDALLQILQECPSILESTGHWALITDDIKLPERTGELARDIAVLLRRKPFARADEMLADLEAEGWSNLDVSHVLDTLRSAKMPASEFTLYYHSPAEAARARLLETAAKPKHAASKPTKKRTVGVLRSEKPASRADSSTRPKTSGASDLPPRRSHTDVRFYRNYEISQDTPEWLKWRESVLGASDAPTVMSENPWKSRKQLLEEKLGLRPGFQGNAATEEGKRLEPVARRRIQEEFGIALDPTLVQSSFYPFLAASLDGMDSRSLEIFEIKCGRKSFEEVRRTRQVPKYYYGQLQHMLMVTRMAQLHFSVFRPEHGLITLTVARDDAYIGRLLEAELEFAQELTARGHRLEQTFRGTSVMHIV